MSTRKHTITVKAWTEDGLQLFRILASANRGLLLCTETMGRMPTLRVRSNQPAKLPTCERKSLKDCCSYRAIASV